MLRPINVHISSPQRKPDAAKRVQGQYRWRSREETGTAEAELQPKASWDATSCWPVTLPSNESNEQTHLRHACMDTQHSGLCLHTDNPSALTDRPFISFIIQHKQLCTNETWTNGQPWSQTFKPGVCLYWKTVADETQTCTNIYEASGLQYEVSYPRWFALSLLHLITQS